MVYISGAVEGVSDESVLRRIVTSRGAGLHRVQVQNGKPSLRRALPGYNADAAFHPWLVLVDLDRDFGCAPMLVNDWLPAPARYMQFRVVVPQIEAWLLADMDRFSTFFSVAPSRVPANPDGLSDAKAALLSTIGKSKKKAIREEMLPRPGSGRSVGAAYTSRLIEFASSESRGWRPDAAATRSPSLAKCLARLDSLVAAASR